MNIPPSLSENCAGELPIASDTMSGVMGDDVEGTPTPLPYRTIRWLCREICETWFREHDIVDEEWIPEEGGVLYAAWHPGSLIDPLLMLSTLPGQLTFVAKHTLFAVPVLGQFMRAAGAKPAYRASDMGADGDAGSKGNSGMIETLADILVEQGRCAIYPEGISHLMSRPQKTKTGPARIMLLAIRQARAAGVDEPRMVPVGLHYSDANRFRERALVTVHPPMEMPPLPEEEGCPAPSAELIEEFGAEVAADRAWVLAVTDGLSVEMDRSSLGLDTWEDRKLLWRTRGLISVHRNRALGRTSRATYAEAVLGARRTRAAWLHLLENDPEKAGELRTKMAAHAEKMQEHNLDEHELYDRDSRPGPADLGLAVLQIIWSWMWMFGLITWGALLGSYPPYRISGPLAIHSAKDEPAGLGSKKIAAGFVLLPLWWVLISFPVAFLLAGVTSPLYNLKLYGLLPLVQPYLIQIPWLLLAFILMPLWAVSARLHLLLWRRSMLALNTLKRWARLRKGGVPWDELAESQLELAELLVSIGDPLILPGDKDWTPPPTGVDDFEVVRVRS